MSEATATRSRRANSAANAENGEQPAKEVVSISVSMPPAMREALEAESKRRNQGLTQFARGVLAGTVNFDVSVFERRTRSRVKYASEEEQKLAKQARAKERSKLMSNLMKKYQAGEIDLDEEDSSESES